MHKSSRLLSLTFAVALVVISSLGRPIRARAADVTIPVTAGSLDWILENNNQTYGDWTAGFETGPAIAPAGTGSFNMRFTTAAARISYKSIKYKNVKLSSVQVLSYSTYTNLNGKAISFQFNYDPDITDGNALSFGRLIYEPVLNGTVSAGTWQTWDMIKGGAGLWYATNNANSGVDDACKRASPCTWQSLINAWPNIGTRKDLNSYILFQGGTAMGMKDFHGNIDNLKVQIGGNLDTYDFEQSSIEFSMTSLSCTPTPVAYGSGTTCTAIVTRGGGSTTPRGTVNWATSGDGIFSPADSCTLAGSGGIATCSVTYTAGAVGTGFHVIYAMYPGNVNFRESTGRRALTVTPRGLTVSATANDKVYDATRTAAVTLSNDALPGDAVSQTYTSALFSTRNAGNGRIVSVTGISISGMDALNYNLLNTSTSTTADITKAPLTVTADDKVKGVGTLDPPFTFSYGAFQGSDGAGDIDTPPTCSVPVPHTAIGIYAIVCSGGADNNYDFAYVDGALTINDQNNPPTDISLSSTSLTENRLSGFAVGTLTTTDPDAGDLFTYAFCGGENDASFTIAANTLNTAARFNFEAKSSYSICIRSTDAGGLSLDKTFDITVTDLPETFRSAAAPDGFVLESSETSGTGGSLNSTFAALFLGDNPSNRQYRAVLSFNTSGLPDQAVITSVALKIKSAGLVGSNPFNTHGNILVDVRKGAFGSNAFLQSGDFQAAPSKAAAFAIKNSPVTGWYSGKMSAVNFLYINKTGITQFRLRFQLDDNNDLGADYLKFYSGNSVVVNRPVLVIQYYIP